MLRVLLAAILWHTTISTQLANQVKLSSYTNAVCLDGTPGSYYILKGPTNPNKWYIHFEGGGWCAAADHAIGNSVFDTCLNRRQQYLGSTGADPAAEDLTQRGVGPLKQDSSENPLMYDWTHVYVRYCDGGSFSGNTQETIVSINLQYRGYIILQAAITDMLTNQGLNVATDLVIGGCSAGALAMYLHIDQIATRVHQMNGAVKIRGLLDSGFFMMDQLPTSQFVTGMQWVYTNMSTKASLNPSCLSANAGSEYKCMFAQVASSYVKTPVFVLQSKYDCFQAIHILESSDPSVLNPFGQSLQTALTASIWANSQNGGILDSCYHHCGDWNAITCNGSKQPELFTAWYDSGSGRCTDTQLYPPANNCPNDKAGCS